jgi:hypothetical protein
VRYFLSRHIPLPHRILLIESGSRSLIEKVRPALREAWGAGVEIDLLTCYARLPQGFPSETRVYRTTEFRGKEGRSRLYAELAANQYALLGIVCSGEPIMLKWKWAVALRLRSKVFIINENADFYWFDRGHFDLIRQTVLLRSGLAGAGAVRTLARVGSFPFTLGYLLLYATAVHARRAIRLKAAGQGLATYR